MAKTKQQDTVIFSSAVKHNGITFAPTIATRFEDPDAAPYFVKCGWAEFTGSEPVMTYEQGLVDIDPETINNATGLKIADVVLETGI